MQTARHNRTIVALATPVGSGGIAVIRVSGPDSLDIAAKLSRFPGKHFKDRYAQFVPICNRDGNEIDRGIMTFFRGPNSYTGEDVLEISSHGGQVVPDRIIDACLFLGCLPAEPGEFTRRAFLNGKMDLSQAEAVADVIASKTRLSHKISYRMLSGKFSFFIHKMKDRLMNVVSLIEGELDFSDDEIVPVATTDLINKINRVVDSGESLLNTYSTGRLLKTGAIVSIIGLPNVGKSSILNALISEDRAIVNELPGTTRDVIEVLFQIDGFPVRFIDTAGLRSPKHPVEKIGIEFSRKFIAQSDLVLWVFDINLPFDSILEYIESPFFSSPFMVVLNKSDLLSGPSGHLFELKKRGFESVVFSALKKTGIDEFRTKILGSLVTSQVNDHEIILTNSRHKKAILDALGSLDRAKKLLSNNSERELVAFEIRDALSCLDRILGITTADDILDNIFSTFCVGK